MKPCTRCGESKVLEDFPRDQSKKDGRHTQCRQCINFRQRGEYRKGEHRWRTVALCNARRRAEEKGVGFDLEPDDLIVPEDCPVLDIPIVFGRGHYRQNSPALDRINNKLGYVKGNVVVISWRANRIKSDASLDELKAIVAFYERFA